MRTWWLPTACALLTVALGLVVAGGHTPDGVDEAAVRVVTGWPHGLLRLLVLPTQPYILLPALALLAGWCLYRSRRWDAAFVVLAPPIAVALNTWVLKPLFDRWKNDILVYPSGHTVALVATLVVFFLVLGWATAIVGAVLYVAAAAGMVGLGYHYLTDIVGGAFFAVAIILASWEMRPRRFR